MWRLLLKAGLWVVIWVGRATQGGYASKEGADKAAKARNKAASIRKKKKATTTRPPAAREPKEKK